MLGAVNASRFATWIQSVAATGSGGAAAPEHDRLLRCSAAA